MPRQPRSGAHTRASEPKYFYVVGDDFFPNLTMEEAQQKIIDYGEGERGPGMLILGHEVAFHLNTSPVVRFGNDAIAAMASTTTVQTPRQPPRPCVHPGCRKFGLARNNGLCTEHFQDSVRGNPKFSRPCVRPGCKEYGAARRKWFCSTHYQEWLNANPPKEANSNASS